MRIKINLKSKNYKYSLPVNYQYPLSAVIYKHIMHSSKEFSEWLHSTGWIKNKRRFKYFVFSKLNFQKYRVNEGIIHAEGEAWYYVSTPADKKIAEHLINGIFKQRGFALGDKTAKTSFSVKEIAALRFPDFKNAMEYKMLSPCMVSLKGKYKGKDSIRHLMPGDSGIEKQLEKNLLTKYQGVTGSADCPEIKIELDKNYLSRKNYKVSKLITIKHLQKDEHKIRGFLCPVKITAPPEVQEVAYNCGIGEKNSLGFGCLEVKK